MNKQNLIAGGLLVGGIVLVYFVTRNSNVIPPATSDTNPEDLSTQIPAQQSAAQNYPNAGINPSAGIEIGGSPLYLDYNTPADEAPAITIGPAPSILNGQSGACGCDDAPCQPSNALVTKVQIPFTTFNAQADNLASLFA